MFRKIILSTLFIVSFLHLVRDILQIVNVETFLSHSLGTNTAYCIPFCDYITLPFEIYVIAATVYALGQKRLEKVGISAVVVFVVWMIIFLLSYIYR